MASLKADGVEVDTSLPIEQQADMILNNCLDNPEQCPGQNANFEAVEQVLNEVHEDYMIGETDPTSGAWNYSHQSSLVKLDGMTFENHHQLKLWHELNFAYMAERDPTFVGFVSRVYTQGFWSKSKGFENGSPAILIYGNHACIWNGSCGNGRPGASVPPNSNPFPQ